MNITSYSMAEQKRLTVAGVTILLASVIVYRVSIDSIDPVPISVPPLPLSHAPLRNPRALQGSELIAQGKLRGPEDLAYDPHSGLLYATCADGSIKRLTLNGSIVEDWAHTGGRPLGFVLTHDGGAIVADAYKGLLKISLQGDIQVLSQEANGIKFKLTDGVDEARDGTVYFTDASSKYDLKHCDFDILEGRPNGRLMSFDPITKATTVLLDDLRFPNGVAVSPDQSFVVFCETTLARCRKHYIRGEKRGITESFVDRLPGLPDNIHYDGAGRYVIGLPAAYTRKLRLMMKFPLIRKLGLLVMKYVVEMSVAEDGGVFVVDGEGRPVAHYWDSGMKLITGGAFIGKHLYFSSLHGTQIVRLDIFNHPAILVD